MVRTRGGLGPVAVETHEVRMAPKTHESVEFVHFHVIDAPVHAVDPLKHQWDSLELWMPRGALEHFALDDC